MRQTYADGITDRHIQATDKVSLTTYFLSIAVRGDEDQDPVASEEV